MTPRLFLDVAIKPAMTLLPPQMDSSAARAMMLAICLQESGFDCRRQLEGGPGRSFAQFERAGVGGVLRHRATKDIIAKVCDELRYTADVAVCHAAIEHNDVLAACFIRCLLWSLPDALPAADAPQVGWEQYLAGWRPGKPRPKEWLANYARAWKLVAGNNPVRTG